MVVVTKSYSEEFQSEEERDVVWLQRDDVSKQLLARDSISTTALGSKKLVTNIKKSSMSVLRSKLLQVEKAQNDKTYFLNISGKLIMFL